MFEGHVADLGIYVMDPLTVASDVEFDVPLDDMIHQGAGLVIAVQKLDLIPLGPETRQEFRVIRFERREIPRLEAVGICFGQ